MEDLKHSYSPICFVKEKIESPFELKQICILF